MIFAWAMLLLYFEQTTLAVIMIAYGIVCIYPTIRGLFE